jgi:ferrous iron transport protein B
VDTAALAAALGCPVVPVVAVTGEGLERLAGAILDVAMERTPRGKMPAHQPVIEEAVDELSNLMADGDAHNARWLGLKLLEGDGLAQSRACEVARERAGHWQTVIRTAEATEPDIAVADSRFAMAHELAQTATVGPRHASETLSDRVDRVALHRFAGVPVFLAVMYLMFTFTINIGGAFVDFFDGVAGALFVDGLGRLLEAAGSPSWLTLLVADGIGGGLRVVATFIPIVAALFLFLSLLEDSGYMARAAFVMDRFMRAIGLPGKAFVPLIVGFGCNVPAVMATRTLDNDRERRLTVLINPFMSCSARLPVYVLFGAAFFPHDTGALVFALYLVGIAAALLTGMAMKRSLLPGEATGFLMELPAYHRPQLRGVLLRTWDRLRIFMLEAGRIIVAMVVVLNLLNAIGTDGSFRDGARPDSVLSAVARETTPAFAPMGIDEENWPAVVGLFSGVLAKEVVVGTLSNLYTSELETVDGASFGLWQSLGDAAASVPRNLAAVADRLLDPLGFGALQQQSAETRDISADPSVFGVMAMRFDGRAGAFAYLLFVLLYFPCVSTIAVIARETDRAWAAFVIVWTTTLAYITASGFYQAARFAEHPGFSTAWLAGSAVLVLVGVAGLRWWARRPVRSVACPVAGSS